MTPSAQRFKEAGMKRRMIFFLVGILVIVGGVYWLVADSVIESPRTVIVNGPVVAAIDNATFDQFGLIDAGQFEEWRATGKVFVLDSGTEVLVVAVEDPRSCVRILDGPFEGKEMYVMTTDVGQQ
jgi:hypothetical protein